MIDLRIGLKRRMTLGLAILLSATVPALQGEAATPQAGVSAAISGEVSRAPAAEPDSDVPMAVGQDVFMQDQIKSAAESQAQLLLLDQSSFTIGPDSEVVIDEFVYDPAAGEGKLLAKVTRGTFRFISGGIGSLGADRARIQTPISLIGIRGTIVLRDETRDAAGVLVEETIILAGPGVKNNANAKPGEITVTAAGQSVTVARTGWGTTVRPGQPPTTPGPISAGVIQQVNSRLNAAALRAAEATTPTPTGVRLEGNESATNAAGQTTASTNQTAAAIQNTATAVAVLGTITAADDLESVNGGSMCCFSGAGAFNNLGQEVSDMAQVSMISSGTVSASASGLPLVDLSLVSFSGGTTGGALEIPDISSLSILGTYDYSFTADLSTKTYTITARGIEFISGSTGSLSNTATLPTSGSGFLDFSYHTAGVTNTDCDACSMRNDLLTINGNPLGGISHQVRATDAELGGTLFGAASLVSQQK